MDNPILLIQETNDDYQELDFKLKIEANSNKNNLYSIIITSEESSYLNIQAINKINNKSFSNKFTIKSIKENKYFNKFDNLKEICNEIEKNIKNEKIRLIEKDKSLIIIIPIPNTEIKVIQFELKENILNEKDEYKDIYKTLLELKNEISELKKENIELRKITNNQNNEISELKNENIELRKITNYQNNEINELKNENIELRKISLENNNIINELKDKIKNVNNNNCLFNNNISYATETYNISKYPLPHNCEVLLHFNNVNNVRVGITFDKEIANNKNNAYSPLYDIYYILEDLQKFYTLTEGWKNVFKGNNFKKLKNGDNLTMILKNGIIKYAVNGKEIEGYAKVDIYDKKDIYLLVQRRDEILDCELKFIREIFD